MRVWSKSEAQYVDHCIQEDLGMPLGYAMENAGHGVADVISEADVQSIFIICGTGNNGGDGMVAARHLKALGKEVYVYVIGDIDKGTSLCQEQFAICQKLELITDSLDMLPTCDCIVDAIAGTGVVGDLRDDLRQELDVIQTHIQKMTYEPLVVAIDVPTGLVADTGAVDPATLPADVTVTLGAVKQGMLLYPGRSYCGTIVEKGLGVSWDTFIEPSRTVYVTPEFAKKLLPQRAATAHKGSNGHVVILGGSEGMYGAPVMAAEAAVYSGAGKVTLAVPTSCLDIVTQKVMPEVMTGSFGNMLHVRMHTVDKDAVAIGPGLGRNQEAKEMVRNFVSTFEGPLVIDADGLFALGRMETMGTTFVDRERPAVLTPHPGEFAALTGMTIADIEASRVEVAREFATKHNVVLVLKGAPTVVALPGGHVYINGSGNEGMGTGGMGDVLTGIISALIGQGLPESRAAVLGVFLHGNAADRLHEVKPFGFTPSEVAREIGTSIQALMTEEE